MEPLAIVRKEHAMSVAELFTAPGELCVRLTSEGEKRRTDFTFTDMNYFEIMAVAEEIAMACRLVRMTGWKDPREEIDTLGVDTDTKCCVRYRAFRQNFTWMRKNLSYQDTEIAFMMVSAIAMQVLMNRGEIDGQR